jgi:hypothetical protein
MECQYRRVSMSIGEVPRAYYQQFKSLEELILAKDANLLSIANAFSVSLSMLFHNSSVPISLHREFLRFGADNIVWNKLKSMDSFTFGHGGIGFWTISSLLTWPNPCHSSTN